MDPLKLLCIFAMVFSSYKCESKNLLPALSDTSRDFTRAVLNQQFLQEIAHNTGEVIARSVYNATILPVAIARIFGAPEDIPVLINEKNLAGESDRILAEFHAGGANEDVKLKIDELITKYGHPVEKHDTVSKDGYVLRMFRIPGNGSAVFLMHGLLGSADDFVIAGPESSLAYLLADEGYDVWIGNARGNKHSRRHLTLDPTNARFWDFSWHEIGCYDLPAMIDYVLKTTGQKSLKYIGHSQGTTSFFVMASERPEYNDKIAVMVALSPGAFMSRAKSPYVRLVVPVSGNLGLIMQGLGLHEFLPDSTTTRVVKTLLCGNGPIAELMCYNPLLIACGFSFAELNVTNLPVIQSHTPSGASLRQFLHYGQSFNSGEFKQFDYGTSKNIRVYGTAVPPRYYLEKIRTPISLFYSEGDWFAHPADVYELYKRLSNAVDIYQVPHSQFNHLDFIWAKHFRSLIFKRVRKLLSEY